MGAFFSNLFTFENGRIQPVGKLSDQKSPVYDGTSGLNYSGRVYTNEFTPMSSKSICDSSMSVSLDKIGEVMPHSVSSTTLPVDDSTKRISSGTLSGYVNNLESQGLIPGQKGTMDEQNKADKKFYDDVQTEYCFYEVRYKAAVTQFLSVIANPTTANDPKVKEYLGVAMDLNKRLNSLLEILNYVGNERARAVNSRAPQLDSASKILKEKIAELTAQKNWLGGSDIKIQTQAEMIRFSAEAAQAMNIQIATFVALNVVAIGAAITVYKSMGSGSGSGSGSR
jgi:hypothetical protein